MTGAPQNLPELALSRSALDRAGWRRKEPDLLDALWSDPATLVVELRGDQLPVYGEPPVLRRREPSQVTVRAQDVLVYLGRDEGGREYLGLAHPEPPDPSAGAAGPGSGTAGPVERAAAPGTTVATRDVGDAPCDGVPDGPVRWEGLRSLALALGPLDVALATSLVGVAAWHHGHPFCSRCGRPNAPVQAGWVRRCEAGHDSFPVVSPAVIMAVTDADDRLLLARNASWPAGRLSVLAGFVEPGEALEVAVAREVSEEVGVAVEDVRYAGNQPWPFPASLMLGFRARATSTELTFADAEIAEARWYTREELRADVDAGAVLSGGTPVSIAYHLIESWLGSPIHPA